MSYFFGAGECEIDKEKTKVGACLHFVKTEKERDLNDFLMEKIESLIGQPVPRHTCITTSGQTKIPKQATTNKKKKKTMKKKENDWLDEQIERANLEMSSLQSKNMQKLQDACTKKLRDLERLSVLQLWRVSIDELKRHSRTVSMIKFVLLQMILEWVRDARICLCTSPDSNAALDLDMDKHMRVITFGVRTHAQMKLLRVFVSLAFQRRCGDLEWECLAKPDGYQWNVCQDTNSFKIRWCLQIKIKNGMDLFMDPSNIPFYVGKIMIPRNVDYHKHFEIGASECQMSLDSGPDVIREFCLSVIERDFTDAEEKELENNMKLFVDDFCFDSFCFTWTCSKDGILLIAGLSPDYDISDSYLSTIKSILRRICPCKYLRKTIMRLLFLYIFNDELHVSKKVHPFFSAAGFGGIPDYLPKSEIYLKDYVHFCR